ncbi:MAG: type II toxin-antitoxin system RelE/ParE family toxin [Azonexus sp.]|jgi:putative addiction module killer protein|nr:type II toxin-antitoxin system RelE/ParE family toxin [Azonexus sp.]
MEIKHYVTQDGFDVYQEWFDSLRDAKTKTVIERRVDRIVQGNLGTVRATRKGVWEIKIDFGPGYRVYYAQTGQTIVLLLCGGDKSTQDADIDRAIGYWEDYQQRVRRL